MKVIVSLLHRGGFFFRLGLYLEGTLCPAEQWWVFGSMWCEKMVTRGGGGGFVWIFGNYRIRGMSIVPFFTLFFSKMWFLNNFYWRWFFFYCGGVTCDSSLRQAAFCYITEPLLVWKYVDYVGTRYIVHGECFNLQPIRCDVFINLTKSQKATQYVFRKGPLVRGFISIKFG